MYNQSADRYAAATQNASAAAFARTMAITRDTSPSVPRKHAPSRAPAAAGARRADKSRDKRRRDGTCKVRLSLSESLPHLKGLRLWKGPRRRRKRGRGTFVQKKSGRFVRTKL